MKKKNNQTEAAQATIARIKQEMQKPRLTESVRNALKAGAAPITIERPILDW